MKVKGKTYLWIMISMMLIASMAMVNVPVLVSAQAETRVYVNPGYINGTEIGVNNTFTVNVAIENAEDLIQWALSVQVDPNVLEVIGVVDPRQTGYVIHDHVVYLQDQWVSVDEVFFVDLVNPEEGTIINATHGINQWPNIYADGYTGFYGNGTLCTLEFKVLDNTTYSLIDLFDVLLFDGLYWETGTPNYFPPDIVEDGDFNEPLVLMHDVAVTAVTAPDEATQPEVVTVDVDLTNEGYYDEEVELKVSIDGIEFFTKELTLPRGASVKESASLDTTIVGTIFEPTNYTIKAEAELAAKIVDEDPDDNVKEKLILINPQPVGWIEGTVIDADTLAPIEGATVTANGYSTITDAFGYYIMGVAAPAVYTVTASKAGYATASESVSVDLGTIVTVDFALSPVVYRVDLVRRSAWPEHHSFSISGDEDGVMNLYAIIENVGDVATYGKVVFTITTATGDPIFSNETEAFYLEPGDIYGHEKDFRYFTQWTTPELGTWYVTAEAYYDADGDLGTGDWTLSPDKPKTFKFTVKP